MQKLVPYLFFCLLPCFATAQASGDKIQNTVEIFKKLYSNTSEDFITDGERVVWVKSYKKWTPDDLVTLKKEDSVGLKFLEQAIQHKRFDVLEQLLPDYYRDHGGVKAFATDIQRTTS